MSAYNHCFSQYDELTWTGAITHNVKRSVNCDFIPQQSTVLAQHVTILFFLSLRSNWVYHIKPQYKKLLFYVNSEIKRGDSEFWNYCPLKNSSLVMYIFFSSPFYIFVHRGNNLTMHTPIVNFFLCVYIIIGRSEKMRKFTFFFWTGG